MRLLLVFLMLLGSQAVTARRHQAREMKKKDRELPAGGDLAFNLYRALDAATPAQNLFFSPLSVSMSLAMLSLGARSHTKAQLLAGLGHSLHEGTEEELHESFQHLLYAIHYPTNGFQLSLGNVLFTHPEVHVQDAFLNAMKTLYLADSFPTNFGDPAGAQKQINDYVARQTKGKIVDLIKNLDGTQIMVMVNYIFFKAKWETGFNPQNTREQDFHVAPGTVVQVPMMNREDHYLYFVDRDLSCKVVGIPYHGNATALFVLPSEGKMAQVESGLSGATLWRWLTMPLTRQLDLYLPRFSIEGSYQLEKVLPRLGISEVFTSHANLSGISGYANIQVSEMVHKAVVEVDESGTEAAAASGAVFTFRSARQSPSRVVFNRPFLMLIVEGRKNILFLGKVVRP
ncbi:plasma serine protease inhibitor [Carlito syrichta]|uniref:Plasma serine protease inhibitor n=1 Tax=Carlito syrichta TaxID=1868482 RepID=A0A1U7U5R8_CARSF|nr:plasma serine protease inhibitor [Carlito syrichta]